MQVDRGGINHKPRCSCTDGGRGTSPNAAMLMGISQEQTKKKGYLDLPPAEDGENAEQDLYKSQPSNGW